MLHLAPEVLVFDSVAKVPASTKGGVLHRGGPIGNPGGLAFGTPIDICFLGTDDPSGTPTLLAGGMSILMLEAMRIS